MTPSQNSFLRYSCVTTRSSSRNLQWPAKDFRLEYKGARGQKEQRNGPREVAQELRDTSTVRLKCPEAKSTAYVDSELEEKWQPRNKTTKTTTFIFVLNFLLHSHPSFSITCQINPVLHENTESGNWKMDNFFFPKRCKAQKWAYEPSCIFPREEIALLY